MRSDSEENINQAYRLPDGMFAVTSDQKIKTWNAAAEKMLGYRPDQVIGKKCYDVLCSNGNTGRVKCSRSCVIVTNAAKGRITRDFDLECRTADCKPVSINMSVMLPAQGSGSRDILHVFRDVTDRRRVENASNFDAGHDSTRTTRTSQQKKMIGMSSTGYRLPPLTTREDQVLKLLAAGKNTNDMAEILAFRPLTARNHVSRLLTKLGCRSRLEAVALGTWLVLSEVPVATIFFASADAPICGFWCWLISIW